MKTYNLKAPCRFEREQDAEYYFTLSLRLQGMPEDDIEDSVQDAMEQYRAWVDAGCPPSEP